MILTMHQAMKCYFGVPQAEIFDFCKAIECKRFLNMPPKIETLKGHSMQKSPKIIAKWF